MTRIAIYARYSSNNQRDASIEDQIRLCKERAAHEGWSLTNCYSDHAISGASLLMRPGIRALLQDVQMGAFDIILAEAMDRLSRDQEDIAGIYKRMEFAGVRMITLSEGVISDLHVGLKGTMNALFLKDLADKTRRGQRGRVEAGKSGGGKSFGYDVVREIDGQGQAITGEYAINAEEQAIIRRIFEEYADGKSPRAIALGLNRNRVASPTGKPWTQSTINGNPERGTGILNNPLYVGQRVWNRLRYIKNPDTGKRVSRLNPESEWVRKEVPELRLIEQDLWDAVKTRQAAVRARTKTSKGLNGTHRKQYLLSGLLSCGVCGGSFTIVGKQRYGCFNHKDRGTCDNRRTISRAEVEMRVLAGLKDKLLAPELVHEIVKDIQAETNRANQERAMAFARHKKRFGDIEHQIKRIVHAIADGTDSRAMHGMLMELEAEKLELEKVLSHEPPQVPALHPGIANTYRDKVEKLQEALDDPEIAAAANEALRGLIDKIVLHPGAKRGEMAVSLHGELGALLHFAAQKEMNRLSVGERRLSLVAGAHNQRYQQGLFQAAA